MFKSVGITEVLKNSLNRNKIKIAFIYGSYAKGEESFLSDIDLMVIGEISSKELSSVISMPRKELMREINYAIFPPHEFVGKVKKNNHFLNAILKDKKIFIVGDENELKTIIKSG